MTDAEVLATFMQPRPPDGSGPVVTTSEGRWWGYSYEVRDGMFHWTWAPMGLDLDACHEIEGWLTFKQKLQYDRELSTSIWFAWNASVEQKVKALAVVLRPIVEARAVEGKS